MRFCLIEVNAQTGVPRYVFELNGISSLESANYILAWHQSECLTISRKAFILKMEDYPFWSQFQANPSLHKDGV